MLLVANRCRSGATEHNKFEYLYVEAEKYYQEVAGIFISGGPNVHHSKWLRFSSGNSGIGQDLQDLFYYYGLVQLVREPTRENYLLSLALTSIANCSADVLPYIADPKMVMSQLPLPEVVETNIHRDAWVFAKADWTKLDLGSAEHALAYFQEAL